MTAARGEGARRGGGWLSLLLVVLQVVMPLAGVVAPGPARAESAALAAARAQYERAEYDAAIQALDGPLQRNELQGADAVAAHGLLGRCFVKKDMPDVARRHFAAALAADPGWTLDPNLVPADEYAVFAAVKATVPAPAEAPRAEPPARPAAPPTPATSLVPASATPAKRGSKKAWYIGGGLLLLGGVIAAAAGGKNPSSSTTPTTPTTLGGYPRHP